MRNQKSASLPPSLQILPLVEFTRHERRLIKLSSRTLRQAQDRLDAGSIGHRRLRLNVLVLLAIAASWTPAQGRGDSLESATFNDRGLNQSNLTKLIDRVKILANHRLTPI